MKYLGEGILRVAEIRESKIRNTFLTNLPQEKF